MTAAVGAGPDAADGRPARLTVPGIEPADGVVEFVVFEWPRPRAPDLRRR